MAGVLRIRNIHPAIVTEIRLLKFLHFSVKKVLKTFTTIDKSMFVILCHIPCIGSGIFIIVWIP